MDNNVNKILALAVSTSWLYRLISAARGIIAMPIVLTSLGTTEYGIWAAICQTVAFVGLSDFGVGNAIGRLVARNRGNQNAEQLSEVYSTALALLSACAIFASVVVLCVAPFIGNFLKLDNSLNQKVTNVFLIVAVSQIVQFPLKFSTGVMTGHQLYGPHSIGKILTALLYLFGVIGLAFIHKVNIFTLAWVETLSTLIGQLTLFFAAFHLTRPWSLSFRKITVKSVREIVNIGSSALITTISNTSYRSGLGIMLARMVDIRSVGIYSVALTIVENIQPLISSLSTPFLTIASELKAQNNSEKLRKSSNVITRITFSACVGLVVGIYFYSIPVLQLLLHKSTWVLSDFQVAHSALMVMSVGLAFGLPQLVSRSILQGTGKHWFASNALIMSSVLSLVTSFVLLKSGLGIISVAIGWGLVWFLQGVVFFPVIITKVLGQSFSEMIRKCYLEGIAVGAVTFILSGILNTFVPKADFLTLCMKILLTCVSIAGSMMFIGGYSHKIRAILTKKDE